MKRHKVCKSGNGCARLITSLSYRILYFALLVLELRTALKNALRREILVGVSFPCTGLSHVTVLKNQTSFLSLFIPASLSGDCIVATLHSSILFLPVTLPEITLDPLPFTSSNCSVSNNFGTTGKIRVFDKLLTSLQQDSICNTRDITNWALRQLLIF